MAEIEFGEELSMLARTAADLMRARSTFQAVRAWLDTESGYDRQLFQQLADLGLLGVAVPEAKGGAGMSPGALVPVAEAMGRYLFSSPWLASTLTGQLLCQLGDPAGHKHLEQLASGAVLGSPALMEPDGAYDPLALTATATSVGSQHRLSGVKTGVLDAQAASVLLVSALCEGQPGVFLIERAALPAGALSRERLVDETRRSYRLILDGVPATRIGGDASAALTFVTQLGALLLAADMSGGTLGSIDLTVDYLQTRTQFGKPIGGYQALKHPLVDIFVASEQGRSLLYHAATVFDGRSSESERAVRMAKAHCGDTFTHAADRSIQFHGAIGFTYECHAQLFFRRAQWAEYQFGDSLHHRKRLQPLLLDGDADQEASGLSGGVMP